ncbi:MAG: asparagine synthase-related protein [Actinomycetota bacterium]|nr:asparagine synthase-related protein [Actinomycetota bacterium]
MASLGVSLLRSIDHGPVVRMLAASPHRGSRTEVVSRGLCTLGTSDDPDMPEAWIADERDLSVAFTGRLDNADELRKLLEGESESPLGHSPASVVAALFRRHGETAPAFMRGSFAVAITDGERLWAFRDQLGFRSLFHRADAGRTFVASEAKQVAAGAQIAREPDTDVLEAIFYMELDDETPSALRGVARLPKATLLLAEATGARRRPYWRPETLLETADFPADELGMRFERLMTQAVERVMTGDDCVSLSGGIDSPAVAAFAAPAHVRLFNTAISAFSALYPNQPSVDESEFIRLVADAFGMPLFTYDRAAKPMEDVKQWVDLFDGPVPTILVSDAHEHYSKAQALGFRTMLTGEIAEFVFDMRTDVLPHLVRQGRLGPAARRVRAQLAKGVPVHAVARQIASALEPPSIARAVSRRNPPFQVSRAPAWLDSSHIHRSVLRAPRPAGARWRLAQLAAFIGPGLTMESDEVLQAVCGIRSRRPWADVDLWSLFLSLPAEAKHPDSSYKGLVRRLLRGRVPDEILDRTQKTVFNDSILARMDYAELGRLLDGPEWRMPGVDYTLLHDRIAEQHMDVAECIWAKDLAATHAFLSLWT